MYYNDTLGVGSKPALGMKFVHTKCTARVDDACLLKEKFDTIEFFTSLMSIVLKPRLLILTNSPCQASTKVTNVTVSSSQPHCLIGHKGNDPEVSHQCCAGFLYGHT